MCCFNEHFISPNRQINIKFFVGASGTAADPAEGAVGPVLQDGGQHEEPQLRHVREGSGQQGPGRLYCVAHHFSFVDPGCLSRILIFYPSRIPDLGSGIQKAQQKRGLKKICCHTFFCCHKFHKI
jgi:hypothetical protein